MQPHRRSLRHLVLTALLLGGFCALPLIAFEQPAPAFATASCPTGTGYGGQRVLFASKELSQGGHGCVVIVHSGGTEVFTYTGAIQQWTVPTGVTSIELHVVGAGGGGGLRSQGGSTGGTGGGGGYATGMLTVVPGAIYDIIVGQGGRHHCAAENVQLLSETQRRNFSFGGGAAGFGYDTWDCSWGSGGGRSAIRISGGTDDIITAGGGGGGAFGGNGGAGGASTGQNGSGGEQGTGGSQGAGGTGGPGTEPGYAGIQYAGGPAGFNIGVPSEGGGGGGGYFGGGGGGNNSGGSGGSSFVGTVRGLQSGSTTGGNWRDPGAVPPVNTALPTISGTACIGSTLTATAGSWTGVTSRSFKWQSSPNGSSWTDISGATGPTHVITSSGYVRVVDVATNFFGSTSANSSATTAIDDTSLSSLVVSGAALSPTFNSNVLNYAATVGNSQSSITITPTRSGSLSTITVNGTSVTSGSASNAIPLSVGPNDIQVITSNGSCNTTTSLTVTRQAAVAIVPIEATTTTTTTEAPIQKPVTPPPSLGETSKGGSNLPNTGTNMPVLLILGAILLLTGVRLALPPLKR